MARIICVGGGVVGLGAAFLLAKDGHEVTVLERDPAPVPEDPRAAWDEWERRGVGQFRMIHFLQPGYHQLMSRNAPEILDAFRDAGAISLNPLQDAPAEVTGGYRNEDAAHTALTARRPTAEAAVASVVGAHPNVTIRRGVAVTGLLTGDESASSVPHVVGVRTDSGEELRADLVIDAGGRRSALPGWLTAIGATAPIEEQEDCGFIYYGRHFRSTDGSIPPGLGPLLMSYESFSTLTLPADNGTWGTGIITSSKDPALRALKHTDVWERVFKSCPLVAHWLDGEALDETPAIMANIADRHRTFVIDGQPVATGVLALADAWACTNPSVGRGITIGTIHAVALRDLLHDAPSDPVELARRWHEVTQATVEPWYRGTLAFDQARLAEIDAQIEGREFEADPVYEITCALQAGALKDPEVFRAFLEVVGVVTLPEDVLARPGMFERIVEAGGNWRNEPMPGPTRAELLSIVAA